LSGRLFRNVADSSAESAIGTMVAVVVHDERRQVDDFGAG